MFYSHEILSNSQYGVATIWLAATLGRGPSANKGGGALKRLTKKAVQEVNVPKACETIINPGAPLALRLQGSLLYGVSRVFSEQCRYMLSDTEKTQSDMMTFFRVLQTNELDLQAGKTKRHLITLQDDPGFDLFSALPSLDSLLGSQHLVGVPSQGSSNNFSFMTPGGGLSQVSLSSGHEDVAFLSLGLPSSSSHAGSFHLPLELRNRSSPLAKHTQDAEDMAEFQPFGEDELEPISGIGLDFDADGNLIGFVEPDLPPLPAAAAEQAQLPRSRDRADYGEPEERLLLSAGDEQVLSLDEAAGPDIGALAVRQTTDKESDAMGKASDSTYTTGQASAANRRGRPRKVVTMFDVKDRVSRNEFRAWTEDYVENMDANRKRPKTTTTTTAGQARKNAYALLYGNRIAGIGLQTGSLGIPHPLARDFAGQALEAHLQLGLNLGEERGRRRTSTEAFSQGNYVGDAERNVRRRLDGDTELGRDDVDNSQPLDDPPTPEMGMEAGQPLDERRSSSIMPWSRPPSTARSGRKAATVTPSPLHVGLGRTMASIERRSDGDMDRPDSSSWAQDDSHTRGLDHASQSFLEFATSRAAVEVHNGRRWVDFDHLVDPDSQTRTVAAHAFLNLLSLASKGLVVVEQVGRERGEPFGPIRVGVAVEPEVGGDV
ncbi:hypothetical protein XA68_16703 [Ophiocordyceps unilateralis]|uniref:Rad21/Rec8-like protein N-terminal domain-containing protein n=1 Tax=Ophiocordyceps unilateralis TaxID=268505 RepID=A0A2A9P638_OPHUN|nr:hypothetical protein XA68_16703 [Ophiocordyceps unilateralis]